MKNNIAVISVNYNNYDVTFDFIRCFNNQTNKNFKIFLADLSDKRRKMNTDNYVHWIFSKNKGYAHGINIALKQALDLGFLKFVVINNDVIVDNNFISNVQHSLETNKNSIIGGKIYYAPGYEYYKNRYHKYEKGKVIWYAGGSIDWNNVNGVHRGVNEVDHGQYDSLVTIDFITGCLMCFDKTIILKTGYWDESYFMYFEDGDWCERAKKKNIQLLYDPSIVIWHKNAQSTGGSGSSIQKKYQKYSRLKFGLKYAPLKTKLHLLKNLINIPLLS